MASGKQPPQKPSGKITTGSRPAMNSDKLPQGGAGDKFKSAKTSPIMSAEAAKRLAAASSDSTESSVDTKGSIKADEAAPAAAAAPAPARVSPAAEEAPPAPRTASGKGKAITTGARPAVKVAATTTSSRRVVPQAAPRPSAPGSGHEISLICRECHEEWIADAGRAKALETIACPACEHRAQAPSDDILHQVALYKGIEQKNQLMATLSFVTGCAAMFVWTLLTANQNRAQEFAIFTLPLIIAGLSLLATIGFLMKYENSRWETYF